MKATVLTEVPGESTREFKLTGISEALVATEARLIESLATGIAPRLIKVLVIPD